MSYAAQLVARPTSRYVRFLANADADAGPAEMLEFVRAGGGLLAAAVRTTPAQVRAYHPSGMADPGGFAAMGCVEVLTHGQDIADGLGVRLDPPRDICARVLTRLFPDTPAELLDLDPWTVLQWSVGRLDLPGHPRLEKWRWHGAPVEER
ncbi:maleylpyruvate isomerase N-terminal domain-containing protein [Plantactinospora sp. B5E13]|uniref:maleylpyruvate isomerase N-terminal domain-containing protein n=1 Tax=unclassified Plantactinospora TaxID=2631981 RepID=UPI00325DBF62